MNITSVKMGDVVHMARRAFGQRLIYGTEKKVKHSKEVILDVDDGGILPTELLYIPGHES